MKETNQGTPMKWDFCAFPFVGNVSAPLMATLNLPRFTLGILISLFSTLNVQNSLNDSQSNIVY